MLAARVNLSPGIYGVGRVQLRENTSGRAASDKPITDAAQVFETTRTCSVGSGKWRPKPRGTSFRDAFVVDTPIATE